MRARFACFFFKNPAVHNGQSTPSCCLSTWGALGILAMARWLDFRLAPGPMRGFWQWMLFFQRVVHLVIAIFWRMRGYPKCTQLLIGTFRHPCTCHACASFRSAFVSGSHVFRFLIKSVLAPCSQPFRLAAVETLSPDVNARRN
jgi:hypothetical protein